MNFRALLICSLASWRTCVAGLDLQLRQGLGDPVAQLGLRDAVAGHIEVADVLAVGEQLQRLVLGEQRADVAAGLGLGGVDAGQGDVRACPCDGHQYPGVRADGQLAQPGGAAALIAISPDRVGGPPEVKVYRSPICCSAGR